MEKRKRRLGQEHGVIFLLRLGVCLVKLLLLPVCGHPGGCALLLVFGGIADFLDGCRLLLAVKSEVIHRHPDKQRQCKHPDEKSTVAEGGEGQRDPGRPQHQQPVDLAAVPDRRLGVMGLLPHRRLGLRFGVGLRPLLWQKLLQHLDLRFQLQRLLDDFHLLFVFHSVFSFSFGMDKIAHSVRLFRPTVSGVEHRPDFHGSSRDDSFLERIPISASASLL